MKTSELTGATLSYAVTMIEMPHLVWGKTIGIHHASNQIVVPELPEPDCYSPFSGWKMCGPIIEREKIQTSFGHGLNAKLWFAERYRNYAAGRDTASQQYGPIPLIAAMRAYVASKLGDEVDVPSELLK